ncbi:DoxX family protein [Nonomuraea sp. NPDC050663]|uniref:DoxX family protein n=1 Tax=unclassified Nonomuraea TaxID=2593643 RepID=UPI00066CEC5A|nr:DoxX family protein [Nonomuraea sp. SBT364]
MYVAITLLTAAVVGMAAVANLARHPYGRAQAERQGVPVSWQVPLGFVLGAGAVGLLVGLAVPVLGTVAAACLVAYFVVAFVPEVRARPLRIGPWAVYFVLAVASLVTSLTAR